MVSLRDAVFCGVAPSLRSARGQGVRGRRGVGRNAAHEPCTILLNRLLIFSRGISEERNLENLAAQIHHLIRKRLHHLSRKIMSDDSKRPTSALDEVSTRMSERLRTETRTVA